MCFPVPGKIGLGLRVKYWQHRCKVGLLRETLECWKATVKEILTTGTAKQFLWQGFGAENIH